MKKFEDLVAQSMSDIDSIVKQEANNMLNEFRKREDSLDTFLGVIECSLDERSLFMALTLLHQTILNNYVHLNPTNHNDIFYICLNRLKYSLNKINDEAKSQLIRCISSLSSVITEYIGYWPEIPSEYRTQFFCLVFEDLFSDEFPNYFGLYNKLSMNSHVYFQILDESDISPYWISMLKYSIRITNNISRFDSLLPKIRICLNNNNLYRELIDLFEEILSYDYHSVNPTDHMFIQEIITFMIEFIGLSYSGEEDEFFFQQAYYVWLVLFDFDSEFYISDNYFSITKNVIDKFFECIPFLQIQKDDFLYLIELASTLFGALSTQNGFVSVHYIEDFLDLLQSLCEPGNINSHIKNSIYNVTQWMSNPVKKYFEKIVTNRTLDDSSVILFSYTCKSLRYSFCRYIASALLRSSKVKQSVPIFIRKNCEFFVIPDQFGKIILDFVQNDNSIDTYDMVYSLVCYSSGEVFMKDCSVINHLLDSSSSSSANPYISRLLVSVYIFLSSRLLFMNKDDIISKAENLLSGTLNHLISESDLENYNIFWEWIFLKVDIEKLNSIYLSKIMQYFEESFIYICREIVKDDEYNHSVLTNLLTKASKNHWEHNTDFIFICFETLLVQSPFVSTINSLIGTKYFTPQKSIIMIVKDQCICDDFGLQYAALLYVYELIKRKWTGFYEEFSSEFFLCLLQSQSPLIIDIVLNILSIIIRDKLSEELGSQLVDTILYGIMNHYDFKSFPMCMKLIIYITNQSPQARQYVIDKMKQDFNIPQDYMFPFEDAFNCEFPDFLKSLGELRSIVKQCKLDFTLQG